MHIDFQAVVPAYLIWVFAGDTCSDHVAPGRGCSRQPLEVDGGVSPRLDAVQHPDVFDSLERDPHGDLTGKRTHRLNASLESRRLSQASGNYCMFQTSQHIYLILALKVSSPDCRLHN